jgi:hypothetical protein
VPAVLQLSLTKLQLRDDTSTIVPCPNRYIQTPLLGTVQYNLEQLFTYRYLLLRTRTLLSADLGDETPPLLRLTLVASLVYHTVKMLAEEEDPPVEVAVLLSVVVSQTRRNNM